MDVFKSYYLICASQSGADWQATSDTRGDSSMEHFRVIVVKQL